MSSVPRLLAVAAVLVGCGRYGFSPVSDGDGDGNVGDADTDGVADIADNCPLEPNADQHDEDGDLRGDVCDNCPSAPTRIRPTRWRRRRTG